MTAANVKRFTLTRIALLVGLVPSLGFAFYCTQVYLQSIHNLPWFTCAAIRFGSFAIAYLFYRSFANQPKMRWALATPFFLIGLLF